MKNAADTKAAEQSEYRRVRIDVPDAAYTATGLDYVDFECLDVLSELVAILSDPDLISDTSCFTTEYENVVNEEGERVFTTDVNSGHWQQRTEGVLFGEQPADRRVQYMLGPLIVFADGVALSKKGDQGAKPIMITLACLSPEVRQRKGAWRVCGYLPKLEGQAAKNTTAFQEAQIDLYLACMSFFFEPLCEAYDAGGIYVAILDRVVCIVPVVAYFTVDSMEAGLMCGVRASVASKYPCRFCWCPGHQMNDPDCDVNSILRGATEMRHLCSNVQEVKETKGHKVRGGALETKWSVRAKQNPLWDLPYGANPRGLFGACPPELLHQYLLGMMKYAYKFTWNLIESYSPSAGSAMSATACRVDQRFKWFNTRHVDPELPRIRFRKGARELKKLEGKDYRALVLQFIVVLGVGGNIIPAAAAATVQRVLWKVCEVYDMLTTYDGHTAYGLGILDRRIRLMMRDFKACFGKFSKSDCRFMKFHFCLHLVMVILEWASMRAVDSSFGEAKQKEVRRDWLITSRRPEHVHTELSRVSARTRSVVATAAFHGVNLNAPKVRRVVEDNLSGPSVDYDVATGVTTPHRELPYRVRGVGLRKALQMYNNANEQCLGQNVDALDVTLYGCMRLTAEGSPGPTIFHASPSVYTKPWYDFVRVMCADAGEPYFAAGLLQAFVCVHLPEEEDLFLALVQLYGSRTKSSAVSIEARYDWDMASPRAFQHGVKGVPFPVLQAGVYKNGDPYLWLVDTESISRGLWAQQCFDNPTNFWFYTRGDCTEK